MRNDEREEEKERKSSLKEHKKEGRTEASLQEASHLIKCLNSLLLSILHRSLQDTCVIYKQCCASAEQCYPGLWPWVGLSAVVEPCLLSAGVSLALLERLYPHK